MLGYYLTGPFQVGQGGPGGWWIIDEPELHLGDDVLVPDIAGWRRARMPTYPETAYFTLSPDWVCEVLSPSTRAARIHAHLFPASARRERVERLLRAMLRPDRPTGWVDEPVRPTEEAHVGAVDTDSEWPALEPDDQEQAVRAPIGERRRKC